jgi:YfiH family protein
MTTKPLYEVEWPVQNVLAFTTTRHQPFAHIESVNISLPPFNNFNLGLHVGDDQNIVLTHRKSLLNYLPENTKIQWLEQIHNADVLLIDEHSEQPLIADAVITRQNNLALAIMTADCLPILLTAKDGSEVAAIHGGWKPLSKGIIVNTVNSMCTLNEDIIAWLGPCIGKLSFEVGEDVKWAFEKQSKNFIPAFSLISYDSTMKKSEGKVKYLADLALIAKVQLNALGINEIKHIEQCTYTEEKQYFSYRRDNVTGRMASIICRI